MTGKRYGKGGAGFLDIGAAETKSIHWQKARVWGLYANGVGATVQLPPATEEFTTGAKVYFICNLGAESLAVEDADGNLLGTLANEESFEIALLDNSTTAGEWVVDLKVIGVVEPPANFLLVMGGDGAATDLQRLDENFETWTAGATMPALSGEYGTAWRLGDLAYAHGSENRPTDTAEYIADTWTSRTTSVDDHNNASVSETNLVAFVVGFLTPETYDSTDTWTSKNEYGSGGATSANGQFSTGFRNHADSFGGDLSYMHSAGTNGLRGFYEYTLTGDAYSNCANDYPVNAGDVFEMAHWMFEDWFHCSAGRDATGTLGSAHFDDHVRADVSLGGAGVTWSTLPPDYPQSVSSAGAQRFKGQGYVFGGTTTGIGSGSVDTARRFVEGASTWTALANNMPNATSRINSGVTSTLKL